MIKAIADALERLRIAVAIRTVSDPEAFGAIDFAVNDLEASIESMDGTVVWQTTTPEALAAVKVEDYVIYRVADEPCYFHGRRSEDGHWVRFSYTRDNFFATDADVTHFAVVGQPEDRG